MDDTQRAAVTQNIADYCEKASALGVRLALEYHRNTLTDSVESTLRLLRDVNHPSLSTYWQPRPAAKRVSALSELEALNDYLANIHVFHWENYDNRFQLVKGTDFWKPVFDQLSALKIPKDSNERWAFLEFVRNNDPAQFARDAAILKSLLASSNKSFENATFKQDK